MTRPPPSPGRLISPAPPLPPAFRSGGAAGVCSLPWWRSEVRRNPRGRELPIARAITVTEAGRAHPLLASRPAVFDALCSPLDEIETLPPNSQVLAANELSSIQAIATKTPCGGSFLGTQYHPEHTLAVSAALIEMRATELVEEGFGIELAEIIAMAADYRALATEPTRRDLIWRYGIASEIIDPIRRTTEIGNWLEIVVGARRLLT